MNAKMMGRFVSWVLTLEAAFMVVPMGIALIEKSDRAFFGFIVTFGILAVLAFGLALLTRNADKDFFAKEGFLSVAIAWLLMSFFGALPFVLSGEIPNFIDALFEIVSGFTTTGASVVADVESLSKAVLYWRSFSHWIGGMGVLVFLLAAIPSKGNQGFTLHLLRAESPGPDVTKLQPKVKTTAMYLYLIYIALTVLNFVFLVFDMPAFEALCTALGTAGTGGFGVKNDSMASYSAYVQWVTTVFMFLFGINFSVYYLLIIRSLKSVKKDEELRLYLVGVCLAVLAISLNVYSCIGCSFGTTVRDAAFAVTSMVSTTGFSTADFNVWPMFSKCILLILMISGACAGSTCGGFKISRIVLLSKSLKRGLSKLLHPNRVEVITVNGNVVDEAVLSNNLIYLSAYCFIYVVSVLLVSAFDNTTPTTVFTSVLACFNNIGPGLDFVGPTANYAFLSVGTKIVLIIDMLLGRLEIMPLLVLTNPSLWKSFNKG